MEISPKPVTPVTPLAREDAPLQSLAAQINDAHEHACASMRAGLDSAREAGRVLLEVKGRLPHGTFLPWVAAHTQVSARTAQGCMRLSLNWPRLVADPNTQRVAHLPLRDALALLAEPGEIEPPAYPDPPDPLGENPTEDELLTWIEMMDRRDEATDRAWAH